MNPDVMKLIEEADALRKQYEASKERYKGENAEKVDTLVAIVAQAFRCNSIPSYVTLKHEIPFFDSLIEPAKQLYSAFSMELEIVTKHIECTAFRNEVSVTLYRRQ